MRRAVELIALTNLKDDPLLGILGRQRSASGRPLNLDSLSTPQRLALEMSLHEEQERRALQGELKQLENQWRAAEEIAAIADSLTLPESVEGRLRDLKKAQNSES